MPEITATTATAMIQVTAGMGRKAEMSAKQGMPSKAGNSSAQRK
jgi:hypothetical protein